MEDKNKLVWKDEYSVQVKEIDDQHKLLVGIINDLIQEISAVPSEETVKDLVERIVYYKDVHFSTEEKYFKLFEYKDAEQHILAHRAFEEAVATLAKEYGEDIIVYAFKLVDFLEDWLVNHLMSMDHAYITCFKEHGLS